VILRDGESLTFDALKVFLEQTRFAKFTWPEFLSSCPTCRSRRREKSSKSELVTRYWEARQG